LKKLLTHTLIYTVSPQIPLLINFILLPFLTPYLSPRDYGIYGIILAYIGAISGLKDLGFLTVISGSFYKYQNRYRFIWDRILGFLTIWTIIISVFTGILLFYCIPEGAIQNTFYIIPLICIPIAFTDNIVMFGGRYFQLSKKPIIVVTTSISISIVVIAINFYCIKILHLGYMAWFISLFSSQILNGIIYLFLMKKYRIAYPSYNFSFRWIRRQLKISLPTLPHFYSSYLTDFSDKVTLNFYKVDIRTIGIYDLGNTFGRYFNVMNSAYGIAGGAQYLELYSKNTIESEKEARSNTYVIQFIFVSLGFILSIWIKEVFRFLIKNEDLQSAYAITAVIIMSFATRIFYYPVANKLITIRATNQLWKISFIGGIIKIGIDIFFIPIIGIWACVVSNFIAGLYTTFFGFTLNVFKRNTQINYYPLYALLGIILISLISFLLKDIDIDLKLFLTLLFLSAILFFLIKFNKHLH
jgi:O-antigen/teichoic acid export membrane protein